MPSRFSDPILAEELQQRCEQILEEMNYADSTARLEDYKELKEEYNELSYQLERLRCRLDPLIALPPEVWMDIIREATYQNISDSEIEYLNPRQTSTEAMLALIMVCKNWSYTLLNTPGLWTTIEMGRGEADAQAKIQTALSLSRDSLLTLVVFIPYQWDADLPIVQSHTHRIKILKMPYSRKLGYCSLEERGRFICQFILEIDHFPKLQSIYTITCNEAETAACIGRSGMFIKSPALDRIKGHYLTLDQVRGRNGPPLRTCTLNVTSSDIMRHVEEFKYVEELHLTGYIAEKDATTYQGDASLPSLPLLKSLEFRGQMSFTLLPPWRLAPNLTSLAFIMHRDWQHVYELFNQIRQLPCLLALTIETTTISGKAKFPNINPVKTRVRDLQVRSHVEMGIHKEFNESQDSLFSVFADYFPDVESLVLIAFSIGSNVANYIRSAPRLRLLELWVPWVQPSALISSQSINNMNLTTGDNNSLQLLLSRIICPHLSKITAHWNTFLSDEEAVTEHLQGNAMVYNTVVTLDISLWIRTRWELYRFTALRTLRLWRNEVYPNHVSEFLLTLIIEPFNCPALEELEIGTAPELDLLFIMLERRNYLSPSHGIASIHSVTFGTSIPRVLLSPLADILGGRFTKRPSNLELSFSDIMDAYFDPSIPGCESCFRWRKQCLAPTTNGRMGVNNGFPALKLPEEQCKVPTEIWNWLREREARLQAWKARRWSRPFRRDPICEAGRMREQPCTITGLSRPDPTST